MSCDFSHCSFENVDHAIPFPAPDFDLYSIVDFYSVILIPESNFMRPGVVVACPFISPIDLVVIPLNKVVFFPLLS